MSYLLYCVVEERTAASIPTRGVAGSEIVTLTSGNLRCLSSRIESLANQSREQFQESALTFHDVVSAMLRKGAVLPFRFPTLLSNAEAIASMLEGSQSMYEGFFAEFHDKLQMDIGLHRSPNHLTAGTAESGTAYLTRRAELDRALKLVASACRASVEQHILEWRQKPSGNHLRCFALILRGMESQFCSAIKAAELPPGFRAIVSGPWPPMEFFEQHD